MNQNIINTIIIFVFLLISISCNNERNISGKSYNDEIEYKSLLTADSVKFWDINPQSDSSSGWYFTKDSLFIEYYWSNNIRSKIPTGDIIWDDFKFYLKKDTLKILNYNDYEFLIIKLNTDTLIVKDIGKMPYFYSSDTMIFIKSANQYTELFIPPLLSW